MKEKNLISIIVPIYNVEKYLDRCIESIINQTYKNLEIILVDDGSPDNCPKMCEDWAKKDKRIKVIHKENGGISEARNVGINNATGDYIAFVDSDDFIDKEMYEKLLQNLIRTNSDISICSMIYYYENDQIKELKNNDASFFIYDDIKKYDNLFNENVFSFIVVWNKLYKKEIFKELRFPKDKINEDAFIAHQLLNLSHKIVYTKEKLYYYVQHENSIMHQEFNIKKLDELEAYKNQMLFFQKEKFQNTQYPKLSLQKYMNYIIIFYCRLRYYNKNNQYQTQIDNLQDEYKKYYKEIMKKNISYKQKIRYIIFRNLPNSFYQIKKKKFMH